MKQTGTVASRPPVTSREEALARPRTSRYGQSVREQRWPWLLAATLMLAAAAATVWSTYLHWLPCRGSMFSGSILNGYAYGPDFSDACLRRMDTGLPFPYPPEPAEQTPWASELGVAATALAGVAWLTVVLGLRWSLRTKAVAALPGLATLVVAVVGTLALVDAGRSPDDSLSGWLWVSIEGTAVIALVMMLGWQTEVRGRVLLRLILVLWGTTAFGLVHAGAEYIAMISFSDANWDFPPGTGYLTGAVLIISAILTVIMTNSTNHTQVQRPRPESEITASESGVPFNAP